MLALLILVPLFQDPQPAPGTAPSTPEVVATVSLLPADSEARGGPRWSPKAASVPLQAEGDTLHGRFALGPKGLPEIAVRLTRKTAEDRFEHLWIDLDRDGAVDADETLTTTAKDQRGKWWSSFQATVPIAGTDPAGEASMRPYPLALWFVFDPQEPTAAPALRWTRRGWHQGQLELGGKTAHVQIMEAVLDGVFDQRDAWAIARQPAELASAKSTTLEQHVWLDGQAYRMVGIDGGGRWLRLAAFDPGFTEAEELARADVHKADREAARAAAPVPFGKDFAAALASAKASGKHLFVDFETTWCGPCKLMDQWVYTAADVVAAAKDVVAVKLDGDEQRERVKRFEVAGYPTMLIVDGDGKVLRRAVGYRSVRQMVEFLRGR